MSVQAELSPSLDELLLAERIILRFVGMSSSSPSNDIENDYFVIVKPMQDALRPIRPLLGKFHGWDDYRFCAAWVELVEYLDARLASWDWSWTAWEPEKREDELQRRFVKHWQDTERPACEYALAWLNTRPKSTEIHSKAAKDAQTAIQCGWSAPDMTREDAKQAWWEADCRRWGNPRLGTCLPYPWPLEDGYREVSPVLGIIIDFLFHRVGPKANQPWNQSEEEANPQPEHKAGPASHTLADAMKRENPEEYFALSLESTGATKEAAVVRMLQKKAFIDGKKSVDYGDALVTVWEDQIIEPSAIKVLAGRLSKKASSLDLPLSYRVASRKIWVDRDAGL